MDLVNDPQEFFFDSQLTYGPFGSRLCTPVCALLSSNFVLAVPTLPVPTIFHSCRIQKAMQCSHDLYERHFAETKQNLMFEDIKHFFPSTLDSLEFAGVLSTNPRIENSDIENKNIENVLIIVNLDSMIQILLQFLRYHKVRFSFMVTSMDHTICFLFDPIHQVWCFDPLKASLALILDTTSHAYFRSVENANTTEYAGLLLLPSGYKEKLLQMLKQ